MAYSICGRFLGCFSISTLAFFDRIIQAFDAFIDMFGVAFGVFIIFRINGMRFRMLGMFGYCFAISRGAASACFMACTRWLSPAIALSEKRIMIMMLVKNIRVFTLIL